MKLAALLLLSLIAVASTAHAASPSCGGTDIVGKLRDEDPKGFAALVEAGRRTANAEGLLWRIEKGAARPSFLYGTIHLSDPRLAPLPTAVSEAIAGARQVLVEPRESAAPESAGPSLQAAGRMAIRPKFGALVQVPAEDRRAVVNLLASRGVIEATAQRLQPWFLAMLAVTPSCEIARIERGFLNVDQLVIKAAESARVPVAGLESAEEQMEILAAIPDDVAVKVLVDAARLGSGFADFIETTVNLYWDRRVGFMATAFRDRAVGGPRMRTIFDYFERVLAGRNERMEARSREAFEAGGVFMAVGALHLVGEDGLVERMRRQGYVAEKIL